MLTFICFVAGHLQSRCIHPKWMSLLLKHRRLITDHSWSVPRYTFSHATVQPLKLDVIQTCSILGITRIPDSGKLSWWQGPVWCFSSHPLRWGICRGHNHCSTRRIQVSCRKFTCYGFKGSQPPVSSRFHVKTQELLNSEAQDMFHSKHLYFLWRPQYSLIYEYPHPFSHLTYRSIKRSV